MRRWRIALVSLLLLGGCATTYDGKYDPAWFARAAASVPQRATPGRVALLLPWQVQAKTYQGERVRRQANAAVKLPVGQIVGQAMLATLADTLRDGVQQVSEAPPLGGGFGATLVVDDVRFEYHDTLLYFVPLPVLGLVWDSEVDTRLVVDLSLLDARGRVAWRRSYDTGREVWKPAGKLSEAAGAGIVRQAHEAAWRLSQQAAHDLRNWLEAERAKPRDL